MVEQGVAVFFVGVVLTFALLAFFKARATDALAQEARARRAVLRSGLVPIHASPWAPLLELDAANTFMLSELRGERLPPLGMMPSVSTAARRALTSGIEARGGFRVARELGLRTVAAALPIGAPVVLLGLDILYRADDDDPDALVLAAVAGHLLQRAGLRANVADVVLVTTDLAPVARQVAYQNVLS